MAVKMVREPSETPNISNVDDFVGLRYAYGNQDGYVINKLNECSFEIIGNTFKVNSGRVVIQGIETDVDANGVSIIVDSIATKRFYSVYLEVNLETMTSSIKSSYDTSGYPIIDKGDDLTKITNGIARLLLYTFDASNGIITNVQRKIEPIAYSGTALVGYDVSKGTVEERLNRLGFREGAVGTLVTTASTNYLKRQGNYVIGKLDFGNNYFYNDTSNGNKVIIGIIPKEFRPLKPETVFASFSYAYSDNVFIEYTQGVVELDINLNGEITIRTLTFGYDYVLHSTNPMTFTQTRNLIGLGFKTIYGLKIHFGYEAEPIN
jgi:hypothetical protein